MIPAALFWRWNPGPMGRCGAVDVAEAVQAAFPRPAAVVILAGTNDLEERAEPPVIAENVRLILDALRAARADLPVVLCKVFPSSASKSRSADQIQAVNALYAGLVKEAKDFLSGKSQNVKESMARAMNDAAEDLDFERAAVFRDDGRILLVRERSNGLWTLPGGWMDAGSTPGENAVRALPFLSASRVRQDQGRGMPCQGHHRCVRVCFR